MPTIQTVKVYEDGSGDYTILKTAVDSFSNKDLVSSDVEVFFELSGDLVHTGSFIDLNSWTTDSTRRINFVAKAGEEATGIAAAGTTFSSDTYVVVCRDRHLTCSSFEIIAAGNTGFHTSSNLLLVNMLVHIDFRVSTTLGAHADNCIFYDCGSESSGNQNGQYSEDMSFNQCSFQAGTTRGGFNGEIIVRDGPFATNCLLINETIGGNGNWRDTVGAASSYNADKNETAVGSNPQTAANSDFVDYVGKDFNVSPSSSLYTAGAGGTRIGAELVSAGGGGLIISPSGIISGELFGSVVLISDQVISSTGISSSETFGAVILQSGGVTILTDAIVSGEALGNPELSYPQVVVVSGVGSEEVFGIAMVQDGVEVVIPIGDRVTYQAIQVYLTGTGQFVSIQNNDIIVEWLKFEGGTSGSFNELFYEYWGAKGFTGGFSDRRRRWLDT